MRSVNKVIIIGNLTRDPEMRQTPNGQNVTTFGVATNRVWVTKDSEKKSSAEFHECVAWARLAEICSTYLKKSSLVYIEGYLKTRSWDSPEGIKKFKTEVVVQDMILLEKKKKEDGEYVPQADAEGVKEIEEEELEEAVDAEVDAKGVKKTKEKKEEIEKNQKEPEEEEQEEPNEEESPIEKDLGL